MTEKVRQMKQLLLDREYRKNRSQEVLNFGEKAKGLSEYACHALYLNEVLAHEEPIILENDIFGFNRKMARFATCMDGETYLYPRRIQCNNTPNYLLLMGPGMEKVIEDLRGRLANAQTGEQAELYETAIRMLEEAIRFCDRYRDAAKETGNTRLYNALCNVPRKAPESFYEACLFQKILIFLLRITAHVHITLGRFDQYMYPYFQADLARGVSKEELFETLELYFISLNLDADTYAGVQTGDNGQSMVLGGYDAAGNDQYNDLSQLCMEASLELEVIDPKINLRVSKKTPDERYELGTRLTKKGLGFPQYCNDDVVVPGLIKLGYAPEDAIDYTVAACWEFIIPGKGMDIPNITTMNFPKMVSNAVRNKLLDCPDFEGLMACVEQEIIGEIELLTGDWHGLEKVTTKWMQRSPLMSLLMEGCMESGKDAARGGTKYYNFGCHGAGISTAADSLAAVKKLVYEEKQVDKETLLAALADNFASFTALRNQLLACPRMGNDDDYVDGIALRLMRVFADNLNGRPNGVGGIWRAGTGSAQMYIRSGELCPATPDGRLDGEPFGCSYSPSLQARLDGPLSVIQSFTKFDLTDTINGGPLTLEVHDNVFRNAEGEKKVAALVKLFVLSGGHQLQINAVNRDRLLDAQKHPENYPNLVVRVWGWSGYFCELDLKYQNHIIRRMEYRV